MAGATLYDRLGVAPDADLLTLRAAYRRLARRLHPDVAAPAADHATVDGGPLRDAGVDGAANTAMALVNEAWRVLSDPTRRRAYDASLPSPPTAAAATSSRESAERPGRNGYAAPAAAANRGQWATDGPGTVPGAAPMGSRRHAWLASVRLQIRRLGGQAARSATQTLAIRHLGVPRDHFEALTGPIIAELLADTGERVRRARRAGADPLDLAIGAALLGLRVHGDHLAALARTPLPAVAVLDVTHAAELVDRMWDTMAHEIPRELELALGGNPRAARRVR